MNMNMNDLRDHRANMSVPYHKEIEICIYYTNFEFIRTRRTRVRPL